MAFTYTGEQVDLGFGRGWMNRPAAASIKRIDAQIGHALQITEAGRTWAQQNDHYQRYLRYGSPIALSPDAPSLHQKGNAGDSNEAQRIHAVMEDHGWRRTVYRWVNGVWTLVEPWHYEYFEHLDNHRNDPAPAGEEDDVNPEQDDRLKNIERLLQVPNTGFGWPEHTYNAVELAARLLRVPDQPFGWPEHAVNVVTRIEAFARETHLRIRGSENGDGYARGDMLQLIMEKLGAPVQPVDVDEAALARSLAPMLGVYITALDDEDVERLARAAADEQDRRERERLGT